MVIYIKFIKIIKGSLTLLSMRSFPLVLVIPLSLTLVCCISSGRNAVRNPTSSQKQPVSYSSLSLSPGTARVSAVVLTCTEQKGHFVCSFRIKTVYGYGSATPPLPEGTKINVKVSKILFEKSSRVTSQLLKNGNTLEVTLSYRENISTEKSAVSWRAVQFH